MEKRSYVKPILSGEEFVPQNYIAACGDSGTVYKFECNAGGGVSGYVYLETNGTAGLQRSGRNSDDFLSGYHACGSTHEAESDNVFLDGYYVVDGGLFGEDTVTPVIVWRGTDDDNTHCTTELDKNNWETAKS